MNALQHLDLLRRYDRGLSLRYALGRLVRQGARVLDAGCGVGLLSFWAAQAGAADVVGVDLEGLDLARALATENGFGDTVSFIQADLATLDLAERRKTFDLIIAMVYLNDPRRDETQTDLVYALRDRYLAPGGRMLPDRVRYRACACDWPAQDEFTRRATLEARVMELEGRYGLGFAALGRAVADRPWLPFFPEKSPDGRFARDGMTMLSAEAPFCDIDYHAERTPYPTTMDVVVKTPGIFNTIIWTQELWADSHLLFCNESVSWVGNPQRVRPGSRCTVQLGGEWRQRNVATILDTTDAGRADVD
jgi:SAM-dependent methyltransferase